MQFNILRRALSAATDLIYPPRCPLCDEFSQIRSAPCDRCANSIQRLPADAQIDLPHRVRLSRARSCFAFNGRLRDALLSMKYSKRLDLARFFVRELAAEAASMGGFDLIACVPMSSARIRGRGYNPSALLARVLAKELRVRADIDLLVRTRVSPPQVGLPREQRFQNTAGAFEVARTRRDVLEGKRVLIIDDVLTTGATLNDCARAIMKCGASEAAALTVARAL